MNLGKINNILSNIIAIDINIDNCNLLTSRKVFPMPVSVELSIYHCLSQSFEIMQTKQLLALPNPPIEIEYSTLFSRKI